MPPGGDDAVQQVRSRIDIVDVVSEHVRLSKRGRDFYGLCPFHDEKTPSFHVTPQLQSWYCFGCQEGGDVFKFVQKLEKLDFRDALRILAEKTGVELKKEDPRTLEAADRRRRIRELNKLAAQFYEYVLHELPAGEPGRRLLEQRGVSTETARLFQLGYAPAGRGFTDYLRKRQKPLPDAVLAGLARRDGRDFFQERLLVPIRDERGQVLAFTGRTVRPDEVRKYVNTPETEAYHKGRVLFGLDLARPGIEAAGHAVLMEGQFDVITAHQHGVANAIASSGTALTEDQVKLLKRFTEEVVLVFDSDSAGKAAAFKAVRTTALSGVRPRVLSLDGGKDPDEFFRTEPEAESRWALALKAALDGWEWAMRYRVGDLRPEDGALKLRRVEEVLAPLDHEMRRVYRERANSIFGLPATAGEAVPMMPRYGAQEFQSRRDPRPERQLLKALASRPDLALKIRASLSEEDLDEEFKGTFGKMLEAAEAGGPDGLAGQLGRFEEWEQNLVREAWADPPPGYDDDEVMNALIGRIHARAGKRRRKGILSDLAEAERTGDVERAARLMAEHSQLIRQA